MTACEVAWAVTLAAGTVVVLLAIGPLVVQALAETPSKL